MRPGGLGTRPMIDKAVTLLPQPDSPTMAKVRPASMAKLTPLTAANSPSSVVKCVRSCETSSSAVIQVAPSCKLRAALPLLCVELRDSGLDLAAIRQTHSIVPPGQAGEEGLESLQAFVVQAAQLEHGFFVVIDAQV